METCPFLVPVIVDRLWLYPASAYCHRPDARVRVPGAMTLADVCTTPSHSACPGYRASAAGRPEVTRVSPAPSTPDSSRDTTP